MHPALLAPVLAAASLVAAPALAQRGPGGPPPTEGATPQDQERAGAERATVMVEPVGMLIATFDTDGDGRTSRTELTAGVERSFRAVDTGGTGRLGFIDFADWSERFLGDRTALPSPFTVDRNGDNVVTLDELQAAMAHIYDRFDAKHDGQVTRAELLTIHDAPAIGGGRGGGDRGGRGGGGRGRGGRGRGGYGGGPGAGE